MSKRPVPLSAALASALEVIPDLTTGLREADRYINDPTRAIRFDVDRVSGSPGEAADVWPDPQMRSVWMKVQGCLIHAHSQVVNAGHPSAWKVARPERPASVLHLLQGLAILSTAFEVLAKVEANVKVDKSMRKHAHQAAVSILAAHKAMPRGLHSPPLPPSPVRSCERGCGRPAAEKRKACWTCINAKQRAPEKVA